MRRQPPAGQRPPPPAPPPISSELAGSPLFVQQNPIPSGVTYTMGPVQRLINERVTHPDGTTDFATGEFAVINTSFVDQDGAVMTNASGITIQEVVTPILNPTGQQIQQNVKTTAPDANGVMPDTQGFGANRPTPMPNAAEALNNYLSQPLSAEVRQELFVMAPGRGVVLYAVNKIAVTNTDAQGRISTVRVTHIPLSVTSRVVSNER